jgi:hypothetical protein
MIIGIKSLYYVLIFLVIVFTDYLRGFFFFFFGDVPKKVIK